MSRLVRILEVAEKHLRHIGYPQYRTFSRSIETRLPVALLRPIYQQLAQPRQFLRLALDRFDDT
jgi:hypothetical protein